jgi:hypothetical protein
MKKCLHEKYIYIKKMKKRIVHNFNPSINFNIECDSLKPQVKKYTKIH